MSGSTSIKVTEAIGTMVAAIEGAECARIDLAPDFDLPQVTDLQIVVSPQSYTRGNKGAADRSAPDSGVKVSIAIMKKCALKSEIPDMLALSEKIATGIERRRLAEGAGLVTLVEFDPIYDMGIFRRMKVFISVCTATVKVLQR